MDTALRSPSRDRAGAWVFRLIAVLLCTAVDAEPERRAEPQYWATFAGHTCEGTGEDLLRQFWGTGERCKRKCVELGPACGGFIRVLPESAGAVEGYGAGQCFFRRGPLQPPARDGLRDVRTCFIRVEQLMTALAAAHNGTVPVKEAMRFVPRTGTPVGAERAARQRRTAVQPTAPRAAVVMFGLQHRDHGCAWPSQNRHLVQAYRALGYAVDVIAVEMMPEVGTGGTGQVVDGMTWVVGSRKPVSDIHVQLDIAAVDQEVARMCSTARTLHGPHPGEARCEYEWVKPHRGWSPYTPEMTRNAMRQVYSEALVAALLRFSTAGYAVCAVISLDVYLPTALAPEDLRHDGRTAAGVVLVPGNNPSGGITNGFYIGWPKNMAAIMDRFDKSYFPEQDYEAQLKRAFVRQNVTHVLMSGDYSRKHHFCKLR